LHRGEEPFLTGKYGSGTIFFAGCTLRCRFCQNFQISRWNIKNKSSMREVSVRELVEIFWQLKDMHSANINFVSPTPYAHHIHEAISLAKKEGFDLPFVYNTHGYDSLETIKMLDGLIDIYLPDLKYGDDELGKKFSGAPFMYTYGKSVIREMFSQIGLLQINDKGLATRGLAVRHLVLPNHIENSLQVLDFLETIDLRLHISLMSQFHPCSANYDKQYSELNRTLYPHEYERVVNYAHALGFRNLLIQEMESHKHYLPDFEDTFVFKD